MSRRQLFALFACNLIFFTNGNALMSLLPVYVTDLGGDPSSVGYYLALAFFAAGAGTVATGWLSDRLGRRRLLLLVSGAAIVPLTWLMGQVSDITSLTLFTMANWFASGMLLTAINIIAGLSAPESERGRVFGLLSSCIALGGLSGGLTAGPIVDRWGFSALFGLATAFALLIPLMALLVREPVVPSSAHQNAGGKGRTFTFTTGFLLLFVASVAAFVTNSIGVLARPLIMNDLKFDATAISGVTAIGGLIGLPLPFLIGWLSDRIGRKPLLILCFVANALGLLVIVGASASWLFWLSAALQLSMAASTAVGSALVTDLVPKESLGLSLSLFTSTNSVGFVIGFAGGGIAIEGLGMTATLLGGVALALIGTFLLFPIRDRGSKGASEKLSPVSPAA